MKWTEENCLYTGANGRQNTYDFAMPNNYNGTTLVFMHGFMGFKDWGCWSLMMGHFVGLGYGFCRFNVSHNGTTPDHPLDFVDTEAFGNNTYFNELSDLKKIIQLVRIKIDSQDRLVLIGHSRGGGVVLLGAKEKGIAAVVSLAGISSVEKRFPEGELLDQWKEAGVKYVHNSRTNQDLPQFYFQYEDYLNHRNELSIQEACKSLKIPALIIHGDQDSSVSIEEGIELAGWCRTELKVIEGADHTFGAKHPCDGSEMPPHLSEVCAEIERFLMS